MPASKLAAIVLLAAASILPAVQATRTTRDGVFTEEQAERGATDYARHCARCHQRDLNGTGGAPPLRTSTFVDNWREGYLSNLFHHIQTWMPPQDLKGSLTEQQYLDIISYILSVNELPPGSKELTAADLNDVLFTGADGPQPLPAAATIRVVGCLQHSSDWTIERVGETPRVRDGSETYAAELAWSETVPLGETSFQLPTIEEDRSPAELNPLVGKKVQLKGVLNVARKRITVFSLELLNPATGPSCSQ